MGSPCYYGLAKPSQVREFAIAVCNVLGNGAAFNAVEMMVETACQETHLGRYRDPTPYGAGRGVFQMDLIAFDDICRRINKSDWQLVVKHFGFDIKKVSHAALDSSPLLAAIFCRLFYKLIPEQIPVTLEARATYWKRYYNTALGKGSVAEYVNNANVQGAA